MVDIFVSYAREDQEIAETLARALGTSGFSVWWDRRIAAGNRFSQVIAKQLKDARCAVTIWSTQSVNSRWVAEEAEYALEQNKLVPIVVDDVDIPLGFRSVQAADLRDWKGNSEHPGFRQLVGDISERLGAAPQLMEPNNQALHSASSSLREPASDIPVVRGISNQSKAWLSGSIGRKVAIAAVAGVLVVLGAVMFQQMNQRTDINQAGTAFQAEFEKYKSFSNDKAIAVAFDSQGNTAWGYWYGASSQDIAIKRALELCQGERAQRNVGAECQLYAIGDSVMPRKFKGP